VGDLWYKRPEPFYITTIDDAAKKVLQKRPRVFIWAEDSSDSDPIMHKVGEENSEILYCLRPNIGGPSLDLTLPAYYEKEGFTNLAHGIFSSHREYWNPKRDAWEKAAELLRLPAISVAGALASCCYATSAWTAHLANFAR
jgi:hypothetical protein